MDRAVGQTLRGRIPLADDHQVHPRQLLPGQPGGQRLPSGQLPVAGDRRHVPAPGHAPPAGAGRGGGGGGGAVKVDGRESVTSSTEQVQVTLRSILERRLLQSLLYVFSSS